MTAPNDTCIQVPAEDAALDRLVANYGEPYTRTKNGSISGLNERFWAAVMVEECELVFDPAAQTFYAYDTSCGLFRAHTKESVRELVGRRLFQAAADSVDEAGAIRAMATVGRLDGVVKAAMGVAERPDFFSGAKPAIHLANGFAAWVNGELRFASGFSPTFRSRNQSPFALVGGASCTRFLDELVLPMLVGDADVALFQKWLGLALSGSNPAQRIMLLDGTPGRGKGVLDRVVTGIVGRANTAELRTAMLGQRFEIGRLVGKCLLHASDVPGNFLDLDGAKYLKSLVGGDYLDGESKGGMQQIAVNGDFNVFIISNTRLRCRLDGDLGAWRRRLMILRTDAPPVSRRIPNFERILLASEGDGIVKWALDGFAAAMRDLEDIGDLALAPCQTARVDDLLAESSALEIFVSTMITPQPDSSLPTESILIKFAEWCKERGWSMQPERTLLNTLPDLMLQHHGKARSNSILVEGGCQRGYRGVGFIGEVDHAAG